ncbi:18306_t:CDS:2, partial [Gigaspora margarita]
GYIIPPYFNTDEHDINVEHDIEDALSSTSFNIYNCDAANSLSSPYFNTYNDNTNIPTTSSSLLSHFNANDFNGTFHLIRFKQTPNIVQLHGPKQKYGFGMGYAKKALDLAIRTNKVNDLVNELERFIEKTKNDIDQDQDQDDNDSAGVQDPLR